jgi:hypothetical protein
MSSPKKAKTGKPVTPSTLRASADAMLDFYIKDQLPSGQIKGLDDPCHYCKFPNALVWSGRIKEADAMLDFCVERFMRPNGDFTLRPWDGHFAPQATKTLHWEFYDFYAYLNQWWITAGVRLSRNDFVPKAAEYVAEHWYNAVGKAGILQEPSDGRYENCIFTSAHLGFTFLHVGDARALVLGDTIVKMVAKQPHLDDEVLTYYNRFDDNHNLLLSFAKDDPGVKLAAIVDGKVPAQCWWSLGYPVAFMAHLYMKTNDKRYLETAERILGFVRRCHPDSRNSIIAHKVMWGASLVGNITGKKEHWDIVRDVASHIINVGQVDDGRVLNWGWKKGTEYGDAQVIDQTAEIAYWFHVVACQMEKAEKGGRLR